MRGSGGRRSGCVAVVSMALAMAAAPVEALPHEDRAVLSASVVTSAAAPRVIVPGGPETTVVVTNIGRTRTKVLRTSLLEGAGGAAFQISFDGCNLRRLNPRRRCAVRVGYAASVSPEAAATAVLRVAARGRKGRTQVATTAYFKVEARVRYAPVAADDSFSVTRDGTLSVGAPGVLGNDRDPERGKLAATLVAGVGHGTLTLNPDGSFGYRPEAGYAGPDGFVYRAVDGDGVADLATVSINVLATNRAPVAADDVTTAAEDTGPGTATGNLLANDTDPDGDALTLAATPPAGHALEHGSLVIDAGGGYTYTLDSTDPAVDALDDGQQLTDQFTYTVTDGHGGTDTATLTIDIFGVTD
jgi:VCBS repeat-containing protein